MVVSEARMLFRVSWERERPVLPFSGLSNAGLLTTGSVVGREVSNARGLLQLESNVNLQLYRKLLLGSETDRFVC